MLNIYAEYDAGANTIEIIDISDPSKFCLLSDLPGGMMRAASGLLGSSPIICGGWDGSERDDCIVLDSPSLTITMNQKRHGPSSVSINSTTLWVVGGGVGQFGVNLGGSNGTLFESTEFISLNGSDVFREQKSGSGLLFGFGDQQFVDVPLGFSGIFKVKFRIG